MSAPMLLADPTLARLIETVLAHCHPRRIVLFGSRARGDGRASSDYDLMIELHASAREHLQIELAQALFGNRVDIVVMTAAEFARDRTDVGMLAFQVDRDGVVIWEHDGAAGSASAARARRVRETPRRPRSVGLWLRRAETDYRVIEPLLDQLQAFDAACYHAHQSAEKYLKAVIVSLRIPPPRTHRLDELLKLCPEPHRSDARMRRACGVLSDLASLSRYPHAREPTAAEARRAAEAAAVVRAATASIVG